MEKKHKVKISIRVTSETAYNLNKLMDMSKSSSVGRVVDKLVRDRMIQLRTMGGEYYAGRAEEKN